MSSTTNPTPAAPAPVRHAFSLWMAAVGLQVVLVVVSLFGSDLQNRLFDPARPSVLGIVIGVGFAVVLLGLNVLLAFRMRAGRNWARIVLVAFGVLFAFGLRHIVDPVAGPIDVVVRVLETVSSLMAVAAVVLSFRANRYFSAPSA